MKKQVWVYLVGILLFALTSCGGKTADVETSVNTGTQQQSNKDSLESLKDDLKSKYDITAPSPIKNDTLGKCFFERVSSTTPPSDYACDYTKIYINDGEIHFIVNYTLKTTTKITVANGIVTAATYEYVDKEEHDVNAIPSGMKLADSYFDMSTGEEITVSVDKNADEVSDEELISKVSEVIDGQVGKGEKIISVVVDNRTIIITVDVSGAERVFSSRDVALSRISSITDEILKLDDSYYNSWDRVILDFGDDGEAVLDKSMVKNEGYGKFFDFDDSILK